ncbi:MAG: hypothetical protein V4667_09350 [Bacteroidota bacterium]
MTRLIVLFILLTFSAYSQTKDPMKWSVRSDVLIPAIVSNTAMQKSMTGVFNFNMGLHRKVYKGITFGVGYQYVRFKAGLRKIYPGTSQIDVHGVNARLAYEWEQDKSVFALGFQSSYNTLLFTRLQQASLPASVLNTNAISLEPCLHYYFKPNDKIAIGFAASYQNLAYSFNPYYLALDKSITSLKVGDEKGFTQTINIGFSIIVGLGKSATGGELGGNNEEW